MLDENQQNNASRALLANVVWLAVADACSEPPRRPRRDERGKTIIMPISIDAFTAMRFIFDESSSGLAEYATWLDMDPAQFRTRLRTIMADHSPNAVNGFQPMQRRNFRFNYGHWLKAKNMDFSEQDESDA